MKQAEVAKSFQFEEIFLRSKSWSIIYFSLRHHCTLQQMGTRNTENWSNINHILSWSMYFSGLFYLKINKWEGLIDFYVVGSLNRLRYHRHSSWSGSVKKSPCQDKTWQKKTCDCAWHKFISVDFRAAKIWTRSVNSWQGAKYTTNQQLNKFWRVWMWPHCRD